MQTAICLGKSAISDTSLGRSAISDTLPSDWNLNFTVSHDNPFSTKGASAKALHVKSVPVYRASKTHTVKMISCYINWTGLAES